MIHTVKLIKRGPWEDFGCNKLLSPKHHSASEATRQGHFSTGSTHMATMVWELQNVTLVGKGLSVPAGPRAPKHPFCPGRWEWVSAAHRNQCGTHSTTHTAMPGYIRVSCYNWQRLEFPSIQEVLEPVEPAQENKLCLLFSVITQEGGWQCLNLLIRDSDYSIQINYIQIP